MKKLSGVLLMGLVLSFSVCLKSYAEVLVSDDFAYKTALQFVDGSSDLNTVELNTLAENLGYEDTADLIRGLTDDNLEVASDKYTEFKERLDEYAKTPEGEAYLSQLNLIGDTDIANTGLSGDDVSSLTEDQKLQNLKNEYHYKPVKAKLKQLQTSLATHQQALTDAQNQFESLQTQFGAANVDLSLPEFSSLRRQISDATQNIQKFSQRIEMERDTFDRQVAIQEDMINKQVMAIDQSIKGNNGSQSEVAERATKVDEVAQLTKTIQQNFSNLTNAITQAIQTIRTGFRNLFFKRTELSIDNIKTVQIEYANYDVQYQLSDGKVTSATYFSKPEDAQTKVLYHTEQPPITMEQLVSQMQTNSGWLMDSSGKPVGFSPLNSVDGLRLESGHFNLNRCRASVGSKLYNFLKGGEKLNEGEGYQALTNLLQHPNKHIQSLSDLIFVLENKSVSDIEVQQPDVTKTITFDNNVYSGGNFRTVTESDKVINNNFSGRSRTTNGYSDLGPYKVLRRVFADKTEDTRVIVHFADGTSLDFKEIEVQPEKRVVGSSVDTTKGLAVGNQYELIQSEPEGKNLKSNLKTKGTKPKGRLSFGGQAVRIFEDEQSEDSTASAASMENANSQDEQYPPGEATEPSVTY